VLLDRAAWGRANTGRYQSESPLGGCRVDFQYQVIKVWELPVQRMLSAGVGVLLLAPVSDVSRAKVAAVIEQMAQRFRQEVPRAVEAELWTATNVLVGLRYDKLFAQTLLRGVREIMRESVTYQAIVEEGRLDKGREVILRIGTKRFGKPSRKVRETISGINDADHLNALLDRVLEVSNWKELISE
jgi:predicted transposase YdaD